MDRRAAVWGGVGGLGLGMLAMTLARRREADRLEIRETLPAPPERVVDLVRQVEREPEFIPGVQKVQVLEAGPEWVRYRVDLAGGAFARFCKTWDGDRIAWTSEGGTFDLRQTGMMRLTPVDGHTDVHLTVETAFRAPGIGPLVTAGSHPYTAYAFRAWLENLGVALEGDA